MLFLTHYTAGELQRKIRVSVNFKGQLCYRSCIVSESANLHPKSNFSIPSEEKTML